MPRALSYLFTTRANLREYCRNVAATVNAPAVQEIMRFVHLGVENPARPYSAQPMQKVEKPVLVPETLTFVVAVAKM